MGNFSRQPEMKPTGRDGELTATANWTDKQAKMIREYRADRFSYSDLMKLFGGTEGTLHDLCYGLTYKTAGGPICGKDYPPHTYCRSLIEPL